MRVTFVVNALGEGGTERSLADLPGLRDAGLEVNVITLRSRGDEGVEPTLRSQGFEIKTIGSIGRLRTLRAIRTVLRDRRPDVVHTMLFEANLYGRLASAGTRARTLVSLVNTSYGGERLADPRLNRWKVRAVQTLDIALARFLTDHFHAVSKAVKKDAVSGLRLPDDKITVVERGRRVELWPVPTPERRADARRMLGLPADAEVLAVVGRQEYQKGHRYLFDAMRQLDGRPAPILLVAGRTGNETEELQRLLRGMPKVTDRIQMLGHRPDVAQVLASADLFVFPSLFEGMPGAVIEAMACGLPIVASDIEPVREVVDGDDGAVLVPPHDPATLAETIRTLLDDPSRRAAMGERNRGVFERRFSMQHSVDGFRRLYERVAVET